MRQIKKLQIGKNGLTDGFVEQIKGIFNSAQIVRVSLLKSATRDKEHAKEIAEELIKKLGEKYAYKLIGYTLIVMKFRKKQAGR